MERAKFIFKVQSGRGTVNEVVFTWVQQGVDGGLNVTT